jgi:hypothetical protein
MILLCHAPATRFDITIAAGPGVFPDLDSALEWMEEQTLRAAGIETDGAAIPLAELDLARGLDRAEVSFLASLLARLRAGGCHLQRG